jgi:hypothetical protein
MAAIVMVGIGWRFVVNAALILGDGEAEATAAGYRADWPPGTRADGYGGKVVAW